MTKLLASEAFDHLNLSRDTRREEAILFHRATSASLDKLKIEVERKIKSILSRKAMTINEWRISYKLYEGILHSATTGEIAHTSHDAQFFIHFFTWLYERSEEIVRKSLIQKLIGYVKSDQGLMPFMLELEAGFSYLHVGKDVEFADLKENNKSRHDLIVSYNDIDLHVEVKTIRFETLYPSSHFALTAALNSVRDWGEKKLPPGHYELSLVLQKRGKIKPAEIESSIKKLLRTLQPSEGIHFCDTVFLLRIKKTTKELVDQETFENRLNDYIRNENNTIYHHRTVKKLESERCFAGLVLLDQIDLGAAFRNKIKHAISQLPKHKLCAIHIALYGTNFIGESGLSHFANNFLIPQFNFNVILNDSREIRLSCICTTGDAEHIEENGVVSRVTYRSSLHPDAATHGAVYLEHFAKRNPVNNCDVEVIAWESEAKF